MPAGPPGSQQQPRVAVSVQTTLPAVPEAAPVAWCSRCTQWLALAAFSRNASRPNGLQVHCRRCRSADYCRRYALRHGGVVKRYGAPPPDGYVERRAGKTEHESAREFGVSAQVVRRWDRETGFVSIWAQRRRLHRPQVAMPEPVVPHALSPRPSALAEAGIDRQLLRNTIAAFGGRARAVTP